MKEMKNVLLGFDEIDITPENPFSCELIGFNRADSKAKGVLHKLKAQILILKDEIQKYCFITIDSIGFTTRLTNILRDGIAEKLNIKRENIMVCFSHSHSTPDAAMDNGEYFNFVYRKVLEVLNKVCEDLVPVKVALGIAKGNIGINRRVECDVVDNRIGVLKAVDSLTNRVKLLILRVTAHGNVLTSDNLLISSDYFGETRDLLEEKYNCKVMITQGASGNVKPKYRQANADFLDINPLEEDKTYNKEKSFKESLVSLKKMATEIYKSVDSIIQKLDPTPIYKLKIFSKKETFLASVPSLKEALEISNEARDKTKIDGTKWLNEVKRLNDNNIKYQTVEKEINYFVINNGCLCGIPDEPMCEIAIDIKNKSSNEFIFFGGYTNGYEGYLPTEKEYENGGYEVLWSNLIYFKVYNRVMPLNKDSASLLADSISKKWKKHNTL